MNAESFLQASDLKSCMQELVIEIKKSPSDVKLRIFLFQLFCINCEWDRALTQLGVLKDLDDSTIAMVNTYQQLIACEQKRELVLDGSKEPTCFGEPSQWLAYYVKSFQLCSEIIGSENNASENKYQQAAKLIHQGAEMAPAISGSINFGNEQKIKSFNWLSDGDVRFGPSIEVMINGGYYWLPLENVLELAFEPVEDLRDMVWRPANLTLKNKGKLIVFLPVRYPINAETTDSQLLSRTCEWQEPLDNFYIGHGQRIFVTDNDEIPLLNVNSIKFDHE